MMLGENISYITLYFASVWKMDNIVSIAEIWGGMEIVVLCVAKIVMNPRYAYIHIKDGLNFWLCNNIIIITQYEKITKNTQ